MNKLNRLEFSDCLKCISIGRESREYFYKLNVNITSNNGKKQCTIKIMYYVCTFINLKKSNHKN